MNIAKPWLLKVLNGPNAGAQILVLHEISVGTSLESDLILNDPHIAPKHCSIKKEHDEGFEVLRADGAIFINGIEVTENENLLKLGDVLTLGSTHLTGGPSEQLWPPVKIPEFQEIGSASQKDATHLAPEDTHKESQEKLRKKEASSTIPIAGLIIVALFIVIGVALFRIVAHKNLMIPRTAFQPASFDQEDRALIAEQHIAAEAFKKELQKKIPHNYIKITEKNGECLLYIYVHDQSQSDYIRKTMNETSPPIPCNIINVSDMNESGRAMMQAMNLAIAVAVDENTGKVTWSGYLPNQELCDVMKQLIEKDLPSITDQEFHIVLGNIAAKRISEILAKNYFGNITPTPEREHITLTGTIGMNESIQWEKILKQLEEEFHGNVHFSNMVTVSAGNMKTFGFFNSPIVSISISSFPYAVLQNGERIFLGAKANNGYTVDSITRNGIGVMKQGDKKIIPLKGQSPASELNIY